MLWGNVTTINHHPRRKAREAVLQALYAWEISEESPKIIFQRLMDSFFSERNVLLVDDINDTGKTFTDIMKWWEKNNLGDVPMRKRVKIVSLVQRTSSKFVVDFAATMLDNKKWVAFPWETRSGGIICANDLNDKKGEEQNASTE